MKSSWLKKLISAMKIKAKNKGRKLVNFDFELLLILVLDDDEG